MKSLSNILESVFDIDELDSNINAEVMLQKLKSNHIFPWQNAEVKLNGDQLDLYFRNDEVTAYGLLKFCMDNGIRAVQVHTRYLHLNEPNGKIEDIYLGGPHIMSLYGLNDIQFEIKDCNFGAHKVVITGDAVKMSNSIIYCNILELMSTSECAFRTTDITAKFIIFDSFGKGSFNDKLESIDYVKYKEFEATPLFIDSKISTNPIRKLFGSTKLKNLQTLVLNQYTQSDRIVFTKGNIPHSYGKINPDMNVKFNNGWQGNIIKFCDMSANMLNMLR